MTDGNSLQPVIHAMAGAMIGVISVLIPLLVVILL
jgi:hypothetical protein